MVTDIQVSIVAIMILEVAMGIFAYLTGGTVDTGTIGMGITACAGLAGYDSATNK